MADDAVTVEQAPTGVLTGLPRDVRELAELASLATVVTPTLLRRLRLVVAPHLTAATEADVWWSPIVASRGASACVFDADPVREMRSALRRKVLAGDPVVERAANVVAGLRPIEPVAQVEQAIVALAVLHGQDAAAAIGTELARVLHAFLVDGRQGVADWWYAAWPRLPEVVRAVPVAAQLSLLTGPYLGSDALEPDRDNIDLLDGQLASLLGAVPDTAIGLVRYADRLQIGQVESVYAVDIQVPDTDPVLVELLTDSRRADLVVLPRDGTVDVAIGPGPVELRTCRGLVYDVPSTGPERVPRVFLSYARESDAHAEAVRNLWILLRRNGVDARLDQSVAQERHDWAAWMSAQIREADFVLVIASAAYREGAEGWAAPGLSRGVQWEVGMIRDLLYTDQSVDHRVLPVVLPGQSTDLLPDFLTPATSTVYRVSAFTVEGAMPLLRLLLDLPDETEPRVPTSLPAPATVRHRLELRSYDFTLRIEFDRLMTYPEAREFGDVIGSAFVIPPFVTFGFRVDPPIHKSEREVDIGLRYGTAPTTVIRVDGQLSATAPEIARALLQRSCEVLWWHAYCRRRIDAELDGNPFVIDLSIPVGRPDPTFSPVRHPESGKLAGYPPRAFVAHRWSSIPDMSSATVLAVALSGCGYDVTMDQLDPEGTYEQRQTERAIAEYVAQIADCHLFLYVSTASYESDTQRKWVLEERTTALREAAELRIRLAAVVMDDTLAPADRFADVIIDGRGLPHASKPDGSRSGNTGEMRRRFLTAGIGYSGPTLDPSSKARLAEVVETVTADIANGRLRQAGRVLSTVRDTLGGTEEWQLSTAQLLAAGGEKRDAAVCASNLLRVPTVQYQTKLDACDVLESIGLGRVALRESARILRLFLSPSRAELRSFSYTYGRVRMSMTRLLTGMGETEGAQAHAAVDAQISPRPQSGPLACDACPALYRPRADDVTVICEACGGHGGLQTEGCVFCGSEQRFVVDRVSTGRPCPICGIGFLRWS